MLRWIVLALLLFLAGSLLRLAVLNRARPNLGVVDGRLRSCPATPNCAKARLPLLSGGPEVSWQRFVASVQLLPRCTVTQQQPQYLRAECRTKIMGFVDDLEGLLIPEEKEIEVRSAARVGYSDFGVNIQRLDSLRQEYLLGETEASSNSL